MNKWVFDLKDGIYKTNLDQQIISYPDTGNQDSFEIENNSPWFLQRNDLINFFVNKYDPEGDFLDIGSGNGFQSKSLTDNGYKYKVICCEPGYKGCLNSSIKGVKYIYNGFFQDFPFDDYNIKAIGLFDVIEHIEDDEDFLNTLYEKVPNEAMIFINVPAMKHLYSETDEFAGHFRRYNKKDLQRICKNTKFKLINYTFFFNFYYIPLLILRTIPYILGIKKGFDKIRENENNYLKKQNSLVDKISFYFHSTNLRKLKNGRINFGTSIFFVLKK